MQIRDPWWAKAGTARSVDCITGGGDIGVHIGELYCPGAVGGGAYLFRVALDTLCGTSLDVLCTSVYMFCSPPDMFGCSLYKTGGGLYRAVCLLEGGSLPNCVGLSYCALGSELVGG